MRRKRNRRHNTQSQGTRRRFSRAEACCVIQAGSERSQARGRRCDGGKARVILACMILVGLTGGVATGKSTVARFFKEHGASIIDADQLARDVVQPGKPAWRDIVRRYGKDVLL